MMRDSRTYIRVHDGITDHPKVIGLSDGAFRTLIEMWCYASRHLTDGRIPDPIVRKVRAKCRQELVDVGLLVEDADGWFCHDYLEHQQSAQERADLRKRRAEAGSKGGKAKATAVASASGLLEHLPSKNVAELEVEREVEKETTSPVVTDAERVALIRPSANKDDEKHRFWTAMLTACGINPNAVNDLSRRDYQRAARALTQSRADPAEMQRRANAMRNAYSVPITPVTLAKHWQEFERPAPTGPTYSDPYPTRMLDPEVNERGLAAAREALKRQPKEDTA